MDDPSVIPSPSTVASAAFPSSHDASSVVPTPVIPPDSRDRNCLYLRGLTVCRHAPTRHGQDQRYLVDCALVVKNALADTGAGPSIITTGLLSLMPKDAVVSRDGQPLPNAVEGPDGSPLVTRGTATITFDLHGRAFKHRFILRNSF